MEVQFLPEKICFGTFLNFCICNNDVQVYLKVLLSTVLKNIYKCSSTCKYSTWYLSISTNTPAGI